MVISTAGHVLFFPLSFCKQNLIAYVIGLLGFFGQTDVEELLVIHKWIFGWFSVCIIMSDVLQACIVVATFCYK